MKFCEKAVALLALCASIGLAAPASAAGSPPEGWRAQIEKAVTLNLAEIMAEPIIAYGITAQNTRYADLDQSDIDALDAKWRQESKQSAQPMIAAVLSNPVSSFLTRVQARSIGLFTEIFVMDDHGLNVGQSNISSDFWQGDEGKWKKTYAAGARSTFIDEPEYREDIGIWVVQVNLSVDQQNEPIGAATFEVNLTELTRRGTE